jgi:hypothetical protein
VTGKDKRITLVECPSDDVCAMCDVAKVADLVLLLVDARRGRRSVFKHAHPGWEGRWGEATVASAHVAAPAGMRRCDPSLPPRHVRSVQCKTVCCSTTATALKWRRSSSSTCCRCTASQR